MSDETKTSDISAPVETEKIDDAQTRAVQGDGATNAGVAMVDHGAQRNTDARVPRTSLLDRLEMPVEVRFGSLRWSLQRLLALRVGDAVPVGADGDDAVTLFVQGKPYANGDLVVVDGRFAFRVREVISGEDA